MLLSNVITISGTPTDVTILVYALILRFDGFYIFEILLIYIFLNYLDSFINPTIKLLIISSLYVIPINFTVFILSHYFIIYLHQDLV